MKNKALQKKAPLLAKMVVALYQQLIAQKEFNISNQLLRSGTSVGANHAEAQAAGSKRDFLARLIIAKKECSETKYWLELIRDSQIVNINVQDEINLSREVLKLLTSITNTTRKKLEEEEKKLKMK
jgi:four helix bundle protein